MLSKISAPSVLVRDCLHRSLLLHKAWNKQSTSGCGANQDGLAVKFTEPYAETLQVQGLVSPP